MSTISKRSIWSDATSVIGGMTAAIGACAIHCALVVVETLLIWQQRAQGRHTLATMDDRMLGDVGLSRADIDREICKPFWRD